MGGLRLRMWKGVGRGRGVDGRNFLSLCVYAWETEGGGGHGLTEIFFFTLSSFGVFCFFAPIFLRLKLSDLTPNFLHTALYFGIWSGSILKVQQRFYLIQSPIPPNLNRVYTSQDRDDQSVRSRNPHADFSLYPNQKKKTPLRRRQRQQCRKNLLLHQFT